MPTWSNTELSSIAENDDLFVSPFREDSTPTQTWALVVDGKVYVRAANGPENPWYRHAKASGAGHVRAGGVQWDVAFAEADPGAHAAIDDAYHSEYDRYGPGIVGSVVGPDTEAVTIRLVPR